MSEYAERLQERWEKNTDDLRTHYQVEAARNLEGIRKLIRSQIEYRINDYLGLDPHQIPNLQKFIIFTIERALQSPEFNHAFVHDPGCQKGEMNSWLDDFLNEWVSRENLEIE